MRTPSRGQVGWILSGAATLAVASALAAPAVRVPVSVEFAAVAGTAPVRCGEPVPDIGVTRSTVRLTDFRFYVSNLRLLGEAGRETPIALDQDGLWQQGAVALVDVEDKTGDCSNGTADTRTVVNGQAPEGRYAGLRFELGLPFDVNHRDPTQQPSPLNLTRMFWNWNAGYKFARIDLRTTGQPRGWVIHLGSTGCLPNGGPNSVPESCRNPNLATITLPAFDAVSQVVAFDLAALLARSDVDVNQPETASGCMSAQTDSDCAEVLRAFGLPFGAEPAPAQRAFRAERRASPLGDR